MNKNEREILQRSIKKENEYLDIDYIKGTYIEQFLKNSIEAGQQILMNNPEDSEIK